MRLYELLESLDKDQKRVGQVAGEEKAKKIGPVLGKEPKQHPFKGRLVGENQLNELSPETLASYKMKAGRDAGAADQAGDYERGNKRFKGIVQATKKEFEHDAKKNQRNPREQGGADSWYGRPKRPDPNYTPQQRAAYIQGYDENESDPGMRKDWR
jgi:hypothetical protein